MASDANDSKHETTKSTSSFQKTVCLQTWWLVKAENNSHGKSLAVAGFSSREQQAARFFTSAPILKRYDIFTLETVDEICVVIRGFIDRARTEANGFTSEVFKHFLFGFPPYWEKYAKKWLGEESRIEVTARINPQHEKAFSQSERLAGTGESSQKSPTDSEKATSEKRQKSLTDSQKVTSVKTHEGCQMKNSREKSCSKMDRMEKSSRLRSGQGKSYSGSSPQDSVIAVGCPDSSSQGLHNSNVPCTPDGGREVPTSCLDNASIDNALMERLTPSRLYGDASSPSTADLSVNIARSDGWIKGNFAIKILTNGNIQSPLSPCQMSKTRELDSMSKACQKQDNVRSINNLAKQLKSNSVLEMGFVDSSHCGGRVLRSFSRLEGVKKDGRVSARVLEEEKGVSVSISMGGSDKGGEAIASLDRVSVDKNLVDLWDARNQRLRSKNTPRKPDSRPSTRNMEQEKSARLEDKNSDKDQNYGEIRTESLREKGVNKSASASRISGSVKNKEKIATDSKRSVSKNARESGQEVKRKLEYDGTAVLLAYLYVPAISEGKIEEITASEKANEQVPAASPESVTYKRSRSGRLLLPALEFWRNQIPVYDADRNITGIKAGLHLELPCKGSRSEPPRKRTKHT